LGYIATGNTEAFEVLDNTEETNPVEMNIKARIFALGLIVVCSGLTYYNWHQLSTEGRYSMKLATFAPVCVVGGVFLLLFPSKAGKPVTTADKLLTLGVLVLGLLAGLVNWYLMDPGFFGQ
jgi:hypothetical protein